MEQLNLKLTLNNNGSITSSWSPVTGAVRYHLYMFTTGKSYVYFNEENLTATSYTSQSDLTDNQSYSVTLAAYNSSNVLIASAGDKLLILLGFYDNYPLGVPESISATAYVTSATIRFNAVTEASSYDILFGGTTYNMTTTSKTFSGLTPKTAYNFSICAKNVNRKSPYSAVKTITTLPKTLDAPKNFTMCTTENSVTVNWGVVDGATSYDVLFNGITHNITGTSITITGLSTNQTYSYSVCAKNADGSGPYSATMTALTTSNPPTSTSQTANEGSVTIYWSAATGATSYDVLFNGSVYNVTSTSKTVSGLTANTNYTYQIRTNNANGSSSYSASKTVKTTPSSPTNTNISTTATNNTVVINWSAVTGATSYDILFDGTAYNVTGTSKSFSGLLPGTNYTYAIRSNSDSGSSSYSTASTITTSPNPPVVPTNISATSTVDTVTISWSAVTGATSYDVLFNGIVYNVISTSKVISGLTSGKSYTYQVRANNAGGSSAYSTSKAISTISNIIATPVNISAVSTTSTVTINWSAVTGATSYDLIFNGTTYNITTTSKAFTGLTPGTSYAYSVRAKNATATSVYSTQTTIKTIPNPPTTPTNISATALAESATISWNSVASATNYEVVFNGTTYSTKDTKVTINSLLPRTNYSFTVRAKNEGGFSANSTAQTLRTLLSFPNDITGVATAYSIKISWSPVLGATSYDLIFNGITYTVQEAVKEFTGLQEDTLYSYSIRAKEATYFSEYSQVMSVRTMLDLPAVPSNVTATSTLNGINIQWSPVKGATNYDVNFDGTNYSVISTSSKLMALKIETLATPNCFKAFSGLKPNTEHTFCIRTKNNSGTSDFSEQKTIVTKTSKENGLPNMTQGKTYPDGKIPYTGLDPVNAMTGAFLWSYTYLEEYGKNPMKFTVMYDSQRDENHKVLGNKWTYSLNYRLYMDGKNAYFSTPYDEVIPFIINVEKDTYLLKEGIQSGYHMGRNADMSYFIKDLDGTEYIFDTNLCLIKMMNAGMVTYQFGVNANKQITSITGQNGGSLTLEYTEEQITKVSDVMGNAIVFTYDSNNLSAATNSDGNSMVFTYDNSNNLLEITNFSGISTIWNTYDSYSRVTEQNVAGHGNTVASYDEVNRVTLFTDEDGNTTRYSYDEASHITGVTLAGISIKNNYNSSGQLIEQIDGLGNATQMEYDAYGRITQVAYQDGTTEHISYDERNNPVKMVNRDGTESTYVYDARKNLISLCEERGNTSSYEYDTYDNLLATTDKNGDKWEYTYDLHHHLLQAIDPEGHIYKYNHDTIGRLLSYTSPTGKTTSYNYSTVGNLLRVIDADGTVSFDYNENGNKTSLTDKMGNKQRLEYNEVGQLSLATDFMGNEFKFVYDQRGNLAKETDPMGYSKSYEYDAMGNNTSWTDQNGNTTNYSFNAVNQRTEVKDAKGNCVNYIYNTMGQITSVIDPLKNQTTYSHDVMGHITSVTNALGYNVTYTYDKAGNLLTQTDENSAVKEYSYDKGNRLISIKSNLGTIRFTYDKLGRVVSTQDLNGHLETTQYDADGNILESLNKEEGKTTYVYNEFGYLSEKTDPNNSKTCYEYDKNGNCLSIKNAEGNIYAYTYDANSRLTKITDPLRQETTYVYDTRGNLISLTNAKGGVTSYEYDGNSNCLKEVNPIGGITTYSYDSINRLVEVMGVDGNKRSYQYDANGNMTSYTDANQNKWEYEYDALNRRTGMTDKNGGHIAYAYGKKNEVAKITDQEGTETSYRYDSNGRLIGMTDGLENSLDFFYDSLDRLIQQTDARGNSTQYTYSPLGNLLSMKDPMGNMTLYTYNAMGQVLTKTDALGNIISYTHDALGQVISITDAMGDKMQFTYSSSGKIATVTDAIGGITCYKYDGCGNLTQLTDPLGTIVNYEYDAMNNQIKESLSDSTVQAGLTIYQYDKKGRMLREINPLKDEKNYSYDGNDNIISALDEDGNVTKVQYDLNNKPISMSYSDGKEALFRYNKRGELVELKDWNGTTTMEYGKTGKLAKVTDMEGRATNYIYDANGNSTSIVYPDGSTVCNDYDKNNRKTEVIDAEKQVTHYDYDALGNTLSIQQPKNTVTYAYNVKGLPTKVKYQLGDGTFMENSLTYDAIGNIVEEDRKGGTLELTKNVAYTYDPLGQLLSCKEGSIKESYEYDILGNRIAKKLNDSQNASYFYNALNQLTSRTENDVQHHYSYDKRGNLTEERYNDSLIKNYFYDATNHMTMGMNIESGEQSEYIYNGLSMRVKNIQTRKSRKNDYISYAEISDGESSQGTFQKREMSYVTDYLSGVNNELMAYEKGYGTTRVTYGRGYERLSQTVATESATLEPARATIASTVIGKSYFQSNLLGSVLFASNNQGEVLQYAERNSSGELNRPELDNLNIAGLENSIRFTNYDYDSIIDKHFAQARFYDAKQGRMLAKDPVKRGLNAYPYCKNNPVNYVDPTGEIANIALGALLGAGVGGAFGAVGSILSQLNDGGQVNAMEVLGASANGLLLGAARGALISSGAGLALSLATNFAAGAAGSALEQTIGTGTADFRESITSGLINASIGAIYGNGALLSAKDAIIKGAKSGAAGAGISYLSNAWNNRNAVQNGNAGVINPSSFISQRGSNTGCQKANPFNGELGYHSGAGYQYENAGTNQAKQGGFSFVDLTKEIVKSAVVGGMASLFFYGLDQVISSPKNSISSTSSENGTNNKGGSEPIDINLKYKKGWSAENVREADAKLIALSEANTLKTPVNRSGTSARAMYKKAYGNNSIPKGYDVDHIIDIQLGGSTTLDNLAPLNQSVNRSLGAQINNAIKKFPNGTSFGNFTIN